MVALTLHPTAEKVLTLLEPHIERQGYELVSVDFRKGTRNSILRLLVDKPGGGIALSDLEKLSPTLGDLLDVYDPVEGRYTLEVSSPGINRPLRKLEHSEAVEGGGVRVRPHRARDGKKSCAGKLIAVSAGETELDDETSRKRLTIS